MTEYSKILARAANYCSSGEKCQHDVIEKLNKWGLNEDEIEKAISYLNENKYLDDRRFTGFFVKDKLKLNKWGRVKISYALRSKHIANDIIQNSLEDIDPAEYQDVLDQLIIGKIKTIGNINSAANKAKLLRFAAQRGFTSEEIFKAIDRLNSD